MPGMTATAEIGVARYPDVVLIPDAALRFSPRQDVSYGHGETLASNRFAGRAAAKPQPAPQPELQSDSRLVWILESGVLVSVPVRVGASMVS